MTPEEIQAEWDAFIDYPEGSDKLYVTTTSALIFARTIVTMAMSRAGAAARPAPPAMDGGEDAERWRAFIKSARIRLFGWAGAEIDGSKKENDCYGNANGNYVHFGAEFWTVHDAKTENPEVAERLLTTYADAARAAQKEGEKP